MATDPLPTRMFSTGDGMPSVGPLPIAAPSGTVDAADAAWFAVVGVPAAEGRPAAVGIVSCDGGEVALVMQFGPASGRVMAEAVLQLCNEVASGAAPPDPEEGP